MTNFILTMVFLAVSAVMLAYIMVTNGLAYYHSRQAKKKADMWEKKKFWMYDLDNADNIKITVVKKGRSSK